MTEKKRGWEGGGEKRRNGERKKYTNLIKDLYLAYA